MVINIDSFIGISGLLIFKLSNQEYCADMKNISAIINLNEFALLSKNKFMNEIKFADFTYTIIDIHKMFNYHVTKLKNGARIILFEIYNKKFGFLVDRVTEIITMDRMFMDKSIDIIMDIDKEYVKSVLIYQNRKILLFDFEKISKNLNNLFKLDMSGSFYKEGNYNV
ncbi:MAG: chemotaxis protein CheW [Bacteroidetes bacterium]|nr:chemotaxis protein CheW [Bacteroidota bacterium]